MDYAIKNVLAATDLSKAGNNVVLAAIDICKQNNAVLHLIHVIDNRYLVNVAGSGLDATVANQIDQEARSQLYNMYERIMKEHEIMVSIHMPAGTAFEEICKTAWELSIDLIVIGMNQPSAWKDFLTASTTFKVIKNTSKPVLTIPSDLASYNFKKILFPVRPTAGILEKYWFIQTFIKKDTSIHLAVLYPGTFQAEATLYQNEVAEILLSLKNYGIEHTIEVHTCSNPAAKAIELSQQMCADLLVINTNVHYNNWTQFFAGPYTRQIINHATIPVLNFRFPLLKPEVNNSNGEAVKHLNNH